MTDRYAVVGNPVAHSKSPQIHQMFARSLGHDLSYTALEAAVREDGAGFVQVVEAFRREGGRGVNVTTPFKLDAWRYAAHRSARAELAGAANVLRFGQAGVEADNVDGVGLVRDLVHNLKVDVRGARLLLLGAGGAARGALLPLLEQRPARCVIANRTLQRAQALLGLAESQGFGTGVQACTFDELNGDFDLVINATSAGLRAELPPVPQGVYASHTVAYEMAYGRGLTPFLQHALEAGAGRLADGVGMLVEQAAESFAWWRGVRPETAAVIAHLAVPLR